MPIRRFSNYSFSQVNEFRTFRTNTNNGQTALTAAKSARELLSNGFTNNGIYWIDPGGIYTNGPVQIFCDQQYDGGGWMLVFAHHKAQTPVADVSSFFSSPQAAATSLSQPVSNVARPDDPNQSYCLPENFWRMFGNNRIGRGEIREEYAISGGTWPNNTNRVVSFHGGRTSAGLDGNFISESIMSSARLCLGANGRNSVSARFMGQISRGGYTSNTINWETPYTGGIGSSVTGISVDANTLNTDRNLAAGTNQASAASSSWVARGTPSWPSAAGSSLNGSDPNGTRWALIFIR